MGSERFAEYFCTIEWHLAQLGPCARIIYPFAFRISKTSKKFFCSAVRMATHFGYEERQIRRALEQLKGAGFFVLKSERPFESSVYRVLSHKEWAKQHPDKCAEKIAFPWSTEGGDELGRRLYAVSGGQVKLLAHQVRWLRNTNLPEDTIVAEFDRFSEWWKPRNKWGKRRYLIHRFRDVVRGLSVSKGRCDSEQPESDVLVYRIYRETGYVFSNFYKHYLSRLQVKYTASQIVNSFGQYVASLDEIERRHAIEGFCELLRSQAVVARVVDIGADGRESPPTPRTKMSVA